MFSKFHTPLANIILYGPKKKIQSIINFCDI